MSGDERERWDATYRERGPIARAPSAVLTALSPWLPVRGRALDVGGGDGRHASWLAERGLDVTIVDVSPVGLAHARALAATAGRDVATVAADLDVDPLPAGPWDVIVQFHYLNRALFPAYRDALAPGGVLVAVHPTRRNLERHPRPSARFLVGEGELAGLADGLVVVHATEGWTIEERHEAVIVARKPG